MVLFLFAEGKRPKMLLIDIIFIHWVEYWLCRSVGYVIIIIYSSTSWLRCVMSAQINPKLENYKGCKPFYPDSKVLTLWLHKYNYIDNIYFPNLNIIWSYDKFHFAWIAGWCGILMNSELHFLFRADTCLMWYGTAKWQHTKLRIRENTIFYQTQVFSV